MTITETAQLPIRDGCVDWDSLTVEQLHELIRGAADQIGILEPEVPTDGVLDRSVMLEASVGVLSPLQHRYAGLLKDAYEAPKLRETVGLPEGKTPFRDAKDFLAKTHGIRAFQATGRLKIAAAMTPARASDPDRDDDVPVGNTKLPLLGALQATGGVHSSKLSTALNMLDELDQNAEAAGKDDLFRDRLRGVVEQDLVEKIEQTTPEEFGRYVSQRKRDLLAAIDPVDQKFTKAQTEAMYDLKCLGPVRGNEDAHEWRLVTDAEGNEVLHTLQAMANNPRAKDAQQEFDARTRSQRSMHAIRDALEFALENRDNADFRGASGAHTQMIVMTDYSTLLEGVRDELGELLPDINAAKREHLMHLLAQAENVPDEADQMTLSAAESDAIVPPPKTSNLEQILDEENLDCLQSRISRGIYTKYIPPDVALRLRCFTGVTPVTLGGERQVLSIGRESRQFPNHIRRAILARDRGCAVPGCHWPASWCELHHIKYWSQDGETSTENGVLICSHHHQALHSKMLSIVRDDGTLKFRLHPLIDPEQQARQNLFWQT